MQMNHEENRMSDFMAKLNEGKYQEAEAFCPDSAQDELRECFVKISAETKNISIYSFVRYMFEKTKNNEWLLIAISVANHGLTWLRGGAFVALFHCRQLLETEPENQPVTALMEELQSIEQPPCKKVKNKDFFSSLIQGDYETAAQICADRNLRGCLVGMVYDTDNLCVYSFARHMYEKTGEMKWLCTAEIIAEIDMCWMEGGYSVALFHARQALEQEQTYMHYKHLLAYWMIPEKLVDDDEALEIASVVVQEEPHNDLALRVFKRNGRALPDPQLAGESAPEELLAEIMEGKFRRARAFFMDMEEQKRYDMLLKMAYDTRHRSISLFVHDLMSAYQENVLRNNHTVTGSKTERLRVPDRAIDLLCGGNRYDEECFDQVAKILQEEPGNLSALWIMQQSKRILPDIVIREPDVSEAMLREINRGNYHKAAEYLMDFDEEEQNDILVRLQYQVKNGSIFVFLKYLHEETGDPRWDEPGRIVGAIFSAQRASGVHNCKENQPELPEYEIRVVDRRRKKHPDFIIFGEGMNKEKVDYADLLLIQKEKSSKYVEFCTADQRFRKRITMEAAMEEARYHSFILANRGQAVNLRHVKSVAGGQITLDDGKPVSVSAQRLPEVRNCLERYWCSEANKKKKCGKQKKS